MLLGKKGYVVVVVVGFKLKTIEHLQWHNCCPAILALVASKIGTGMDNWHHHIPFVWSMEPSQPKICQILCNYLC